MFTKTSTRNLQMELRLSVLSLTPTGSSAPPYALMSSGLPYRNCSTTRRLFRVSANFTTEIGYQEIKLPLRSQWWTRNSLQYALFHRHSDKITWVSRRPHCGMQRVWVFRGDYESECRPRLRRSLAGSVVHQSQLLQ